MPATTTHFSGHFPGKRGLAEIKSVSPSYAIKHGTFPRHTAALKSGVTEYLPPPPTSVKASTLFTICMHLAKMMVKFLPGPNLRLLLRLPQLQDNSNRRTTRFRRLDSLQVNGQKPKDEIENYRT